MKFYVSLLMLVFSGCAHGDLPGSAALTPRMLVEHATEHDGEVVTVRGYIKIGSESYGIWTNKEAERKGEFLKDCISLRVPEGMDLSSVNESMVEITGGFSARIRDDLIKLGSCNFPMIQIDAVPKRI